MTKPPKSQSTPDPQSENIDKILAHLLGNYHNNLTKTRQEWEDEAKAALLQWRTESVLAMLPKKKYSDGHNAAHTWITNGYCHACKKTLSPKQLEEEFVFNSAIDEITNSLTKGGQDE
jgi:hypothetical protein